MLLALLWQTVTLPAPVTVGKAIGSLDHPFTRVFSVMERRDGRLIVVDRSDESVSIADFDVGRVTRIGRTGGGPAEYRFPGRLVPMEGDSAILLDDGNNRLLVLDADLTSHRAISGVTPGLPIELGPRAVDRSGRFYAVIPGWATSQGGPPPDSRRPTDSELATAAGPPAGGPRTGADLPGRDRRGR